MDVLIVESNPHLGNIWRRHLERLGHIVHLTVNQHQAIHILQTRPISIIVLNVVLAEGSALAVADFASYRYPTMKVLCVTSSSFFSDGSIFGHIGNACALLPSTSPAGDIAALLEYHATG